MKKIISFILSFVMISGIFSVTAFAEETEEQSLEDIIRPQIEAFAKSIDKSDADGDAADALAKHGMFKGGKDLRVDESHALTATLVNSELSKEYFTDACVQLIEAANAEKLKKVYNIGVCSWYKDRKHYKFWIYDYDAERNINGSEITWPEDYIKKNDDTVIKYENEYDDSLEWIAGHTWADMEIEVVCAKKEKIIYKVNVVFRDKFDFATSAGSGFGDLISGIGALLFKEFTWYSIFDFKIEIPNDCEHSFGDWKTVKNPSCAENGMEERICGNCGCVENRAISAVGHSL